MSLSISMVHIGLFGGGHAQGRITLFVPDQCKTHPDECDTHTGGCQTPSGECFEDWIGQSDKEIVTLQVDI